MAFSSPRWCRGALTVIGLAVLLGGCSSRGGSAAASPAPAPAPPGQLTLQIGDLIQVNIWREGELSGNFIIDEHGIVTLPLLGPVRAAGVRYDQLRDELVRRYLAEVKSTSIVITPTRRIYVLGEVNKPNVYNVDPTTPLAGVVALAGGATNEGDLDRIRVVRAGQVVTERASAQTALNVGDIRSGDQILVGRRGWLTRNTPFLVQSAFSITNIILTVILARDRGGDG